MRFSAGRTAGTAAAPARVRRCSDPSEFAGLSAGWNRLADSSPQPSLYLTHEWMSGWLANTHPGFDELCILVASGGEGVDGIAPLVKRRVPWTGLVKLELMTMGSYAYTPSNLSGSLDFIAAAGNDDALDAMARYLSDHEGEWHYLRLHPVPESSPTIPRLSGWAGRSGYRCSVRRVLSNAVVSLPPTAGQYLALLSPHFRKNLRRIGNLLGREGGVRVIEVTSPGDVGGAFDAMIGIERRSWKSRGGLSLETPAVRGFYETQARTAAGRGALTLWMLEIGGKPVAYDLGIVHAGRVEILKGSYDAGFARLSPGIFLTLEEMKSFIARGHRSVSLLWGDLTYKLRWAAQKEQCCEIYVCNRRLAARAFHRTYVMTGAYRGIRFLRNLPGRRPS